MTDSSSPDEPWHEIEAAIAPVEQQLQELKTRLGQVQQAQARLEPLKAREHHLQTAHPPAWKTELRQLSQAIVAIELNLESRLINWQSFRQPFWQIVRFGGLGFVLGWLLHELTQSS
ncbi:MAG: DUF2203 domain-containing protein [Cyanobacteria bacterium P01_G01_bin.54]